MFEENQNAAARASYQTQLAPSAFEGKTVETLMNAAPVVVSPDMTLFEFVNQTMLHSHVSFVPVVEARTLLGHMDQTFLFGIDRENWGNTSVEDVFAGLDPKANVPPDMSAQQLVATIAKTSQRKFLVTQGHALVGVITLADLTQYLHIAGSLRQNSEAGKHIPG